MNKYMLALCCCMTVSLIAEDLQKKTSPTKIVSSPLEEKPVKISAPLAEPITIRVADPMVMLQNSDQWKDIAGKAQQDMERKAKELEKLQTEYMTQADQLQSMGSTVKPDVKSEKETKLMTLKSEIQIKNEILQRDAEEAGRRAQTEIFKEIEQASAEVGRQKGYDLILANGVLYASDKMDVTNEIVGRMNEKYTEHKKRQEKPLAKKSETKEETKPNTR